jgi:hypothetical protein
MPWSCFASFVDLSRSHDHQLSLAEANLIAAMATFPQQCDAASSDQVKSPLVSEHGLSMARQENRELEPEAPLRTSKALWGWLILCFSVSITRLGEHQDTDQNRPVRPAPWRFNTLRQQFSLRPTLLVINQARQGPAQRGEPFRVW